MTALAIAELETVRFLRRRETSWLFLSAALVCALPFAVLTFWPKADIVPGGPDFPFLLKVEMYRDLLMALEPIAVISLGYFFAYDSMSREIDRGSLTLIRLTPMSPRSILLGKGLGSAILVTLLHSLCSLFLLAPTQVLRHDPVWGAIWYFAVLAFALGLVPGAFADAECRKERLLYWILRVGGVIRVSLAIPFALLFLRPESAVGAIGLADAMIKSAFGVFSRERIPIGAFFSSPGGALAAMVGWHLATSIPIFLWLEARMRR